MKNNETIWNLYAPVYDKFMKMNDSAYEKLYEKIRAVCFDKNVLEIATGTGKIAKHISASAKQTIAVDFAENMLKEAQKGIIPSNLTFRQASADALPFSDNSFDVVIIANALHVIEKPERVLSEIARVLKPEGILIAPNFIHENGNRRTAFWSKMLSVAGITFDAHWSEETYPEFLEENGWSVGNTEIFDGAIPMMYVECIHSEKFADEKIEIPSKPEYRNWMPEKLIHQLELGTDVFALGMAVSMIAGDRKNKKNNLLSIGLSVGTLAMTSATIWAKNMHKAFDYDGTRQMSRQIVEGVAKYIELPENGVGLDVGCGSGALTIACAKNNPQGRMVGIDRWGKEYDCFNLKLCEKNALAEGVKNVTFAQGDAMHLDFPDESFDCVTSNYVYHNIMGEDKQALILETLRVLKKGGTFAIHDIMSKSHYGDIQKLINKLEELGFERVELIDTTDCKFMTPWESKWMFLSGSSLLIGKK
ncbi:MAG TPA: hypothetical protein DCO72_06190 [Ruminococcus sp.]|nr:hypothetical protein [Ruminococcus sp.]